MKRNLVGILVIMILSIVLFETVGAQTASPSGQKTLAATLNVYVFPTEGQTSEQQSKDEAECYGWAVEKNTGTCSTAKMPPNMTNQMSRNPS